MRKDQPPRSDTHDSRSGLPLLFTTDAIPDRDKFDYWRSICKESFPTFEFSDYELRDFHAELAFSAIGSLKVGHYKGSPHTMNSRPSRLQSGGNDDFVVIMESPNKTFNLEHGSLHRSGRGGITLLDNTKPFDGGHPEGLDIIDFFIPRAEIERALGPARLATGLTIEADTASYRIVSAYLQSLIDHGSALDETRAARMSSIAVELIAAGFAEKIEQSPARSLSGAATVCRAQAYIAENIHKSGMSLPEIAAALQVSVRYLHRASAGENLSLMDWMWEKRLMIARDKLARPAHRTTSVAIIAHQCGFADQAHFSRRFKERFGMPPTEYRIWTAASPNSR